MSGATGERILEEMEHGEEVSGWPDGFQLTFARTGLEDEDDDLHQHVIPEPASNN
jgi:hypothetical protein